MKAIPSGTQIAEEIRGRIRAETELAASAGVSYNSRTGDWPRSLEEMEGLHRR